MPWLLLICTFFSDFLHFDKSLLLLTVTLRGVSNKHCLLSLFFIIAENIRSCVSDPYSVSVKSFANWLQRGCSVLTYTAQQKFSTGFIFV